MALGEYIGAGSGVTKLLLHLNGNSNDSSGNGNNGTDTNISYSNDYGKFGQGASFNGSSSKIITSNNINPGTDKITLCLWIKTTTTSTQIIVEHGTNYATSHTFALYIGEVAAGKLSWLDYNSGYNYVASNKTVNDGNYHNIIATIDRSLNATAGQRLFIDGIDDTVSGYRGYSNNNNGNFPSAKLYIGSRAGTTAYYSGYLDELILENRAWTAAEIQKYYTMAKGRFGIL